nr:triple gene block 2 [Grapevine carlavirus 1]
MPIQQPSDHSKSILAASVGIVVALVINQLRSHTSPIGGDPYHKLPYGGLYKDGTKSIHYYPQHWKPVGGEPALPNIYLLILVLLLIITLRILHGLNKGSTRRCTCST